MKLENEAVYGYMIWIIKNYFLNRARFTFINKASC